MRVRAPTMTCFDDDDYGSDERFAMNMPTEKSDFRFQHSEISRYRCCFMKREKKERKKNKYIFIRERITMFKDGKRETMYELEGERNDSKSTEKEGEDETMWHSIHCSQCVHCVRNMKRMQNSSGFS